jgi:hypothetical protein
MKKMSTINISGVILILLSALPLSSIAEVNFQGFASFVGGATLESDETYSGYVNKIEYDKNSVYGLQAVSNLGDGLKATGQIIARGSENYKPEFEWMYLSYNITPTLSAKFGRIRTPFYMQSEYLEVGYTYHWIRPPEELYAAQITNMDGASLLYNVPMGSIDGQFVVSIANRRGYSEDSSTTVSDFTSIVATTAQFEFEGHSAKLIYVQGDLTFESTGITDAETDFAAAGATFIADHVSIKDKPLIFTGVGFDLNFDAVKVVLEYSQLDFDELLLIASKEARSLASVAYSFDDSSISYSLSGNKKEGDTAIVSKVAAQLQPTILAVLASTDRDVTTHTLGLRHDFHDSAAFKVELISTEESKLDTKATLVRFGVDMIF